MSSAALEAPEAFDGFQYPRGDPAQHHLAAPPALDVALDVSGATEQALGGIPITLRGEPMRITEIATRDISRWVSGAIQFTPKEKGLLTQRARAILADKATAL